MSVWYGFCTFWTDDWGQLNLATGTMLPYPTHEGIPCCPECGSVGFKMNLDEWWEGVEAFEQSGNPGYMQFVMEIKNTCKGKGVSIADLWEKQKEDSAYPYDGVEEEKRGWRKPPGD